MKKALDHLIDSRFLGMLLLIFKGFEMLELISMIVSLLRMLLMVTCIETCECVDLNVSLELCLSPVVVCRISLQCLFTRQALAT